MTIRRFMLVIAATLVAGSAPAEEAAKPQGVRKTTGGSAEIERHLADWCVAMSKPTSRSRRIEMFSGMSRRQQILDVLKKFVLDDLFSRTGVCGQRVFLVELH
jgi:hypothetical protein